MDREADMFGARVRDPIRPQKQPNRAGVQGIRGFAIRPRLTTTGASGDVGYRLRLRDVFAGSVAGASHLYQSLLGTYRIGKCPCQRRQVQPNPLRLLLPCNHARWPFYCAIPFCYRMAVSECDVSCAMANIGTYSDQSKSWHASMNTAFLCFVVDRSGLDWLRYCTCSSKSSTQRACTIISIDRHTRLACVTLRQKTFI